MPGPLCRAFPRSRAFRASRACRTGQSTELSNRFQHPAGSKWNRPLLQSCWKMNASTTSLRRLLSREITRAGRILLSDRSVKGNRVRTISPKDIIRDGRRRGYTGRVLPRETQRFRLLRPSARVAGYRSAYRGRGGLSGARKFPASGLRPRGCRPLCLRERSAYEDYNLRSGGGKGFNLLATAGLVSLRR